MRNVIIMSVGILMVAACTGVASAQPFVHHGSIGKHAVQNANMEQRDDGVPLDQWLGMRFIILPKPADQQRYGYSTLRGSFEGFVVPTYEECAGQIGTVVDVYDDEHTDRQLILQLEDGREYSAVSVDGIFRELAPVSDLEHAQELWRGKTIWTYAGSAREYDAQTGRLYAFDTDEMEPVTVTDVVAGWDHNRPVRLILKTQDGYEGFIDVQVSSTNVSESLRGRNRSPAFFRTEDPHLN